MSPPKPSAYIRRKPLQVDIFERNVFSPTTKRLTRFKVELSLSDTLRMAYRYGTPVAWMIPSDPLSAEIDPPLEVLAPAVVMFSLVTQRHGDVVVGGLMFHSAADEKRYADWYDSTS